MNEGGVVGVGADFCANACAHIGMYVCMCVCSDVCAMAVDCIGGGMYVEGVVCRCKCLC